MSEQPVYSLPVDDSTRAFIQKELNATSQESYFQGWVNWVFGDVYVKKRVIVVANFRLWAIKLSLLGKSIRQSLPVLSLKSMSVQDDKLHLFFAGHGKCEIHHPDAVGIGQKLLFAYHSVANNRPASMQPELKLPKHFWATYTPPKPDFQDALLAAYCAECDILKQTASAAVLDFFVECFVKKRRVLDMNALLDAVTLSGVQLNESLESKSESSDANVSGGGPVCVLKPDMLTPLVRALQFCSYFEAVTLKARSYPHTYSLKNPECLGLLGLLFGSRTRIESLDLVGVRGVGRGLGALAESLPTYKYLKRLDLSNNPNLGSELYQFISAVFPPLTDVGEHVPATLSELRLSSVGLDDKAGAGIFAVLAKRKNTQCMRVWDLSNNALGKRTALRVSDWLHEMYPVYDLAESKVREAMHKQFTSRGRHPAPRILKLRSFDIPIQFACSLQTLNFAHCDLPASVICDGIVRSSVHTQGLHTLILAHNNASDSANAGLIKLSQEQFERYYSPDKSVHRWTQRCARSGQWFKCDHAYPKNGKLSMRDVLYALCRQSVTLRSLSLCSTGLSADGFLGLLQGVFSNFYSTKFSLDCSQNDLGHKGAAKIAKFLADWQLKPAWREKICEIGAIHALDISETNLGLTGLSEVLTALTGVYVRVLRINQCIKTGMFSKSKQENLAEVLVKYVSGSPQLKSLSVRGGPSGQAGKLLHPLFIAISAHRVKSLESLDVSCNRLGEAGFNLLCQSINRTNCLRVVQFDNNKLCGPFPFSLHAAILANKSIVFNCLPVAEMQTLVKKSKNREKLQSVCEELEASIDDNLVGYLNKWDRWAELAHSSTSMSLPEIKSLQKDLQEVSNGKIPYQAVVPVWSFDVLTDAFGAYSLPNRDIYTANTQGAGTGVPASLKGLSSRQLNAIAAHQRAVLQGSSGIDAMLQAAGVDLSKSEAKGDGLSTKTEDPWAVSSLPMRGRQTSAWIFGSKPATAGKTTNKMVQNGAKTSTGSDQTASYSHNPMLAAMQRKKAAILAKKQLMANAQSGDSSSGSDEIDSGSSDEFGGSEELDSDMYDNDVEYLDERAEEEVVDGGGDLVVFME